MNNPVEYKYVDSTQIQMTPKSFNYKIGYFLGSIIGLCLTACVVAGTIRFIMWLF